MLKRRETFFMLILLVAIFTGCTKSKLTAGNRQTAILYQCTDKSVEPYIYFDSLLTDSRCPTGAVCFTIGNALIKITFHEHQASHTFVMSLKGVPSEGFPSGTTINGYQVVFTNLDPYPDVNTTTSQKKASFTIFR
jgi:hypothetical protein